MCVCVISCEWYLHLLSEAVLFQTVSCILSLHGCVAQAAIIYAEGEAEAATLISEAVKVGGNGMIEVKRIDVSVMLPLQLPLLPVWKDLVLLCCLV